MGSGYTFDGQAVLWHVTGPPYRFPIHCAGKMEGSGVFVSFQKSIVFLLNMVFWQLGEQLVRAKGVFVSLSSVLLCLCQNNVFKEALIYF